MKLKLALYRRSDQHPWTCVYLQVDQNPALNVNEPASTLPLNAKDGIKALCLLTAETYQGRKGNPQNTPSSLDQETLKPLWNAKKAKWIESLFGTGGYSRAILAKGSNKRFSVTLQPNVEPHIELLSDGDQEEAVTQVIQQHLLTSQRPSISPFEIRLLLQDRIISSLGGYGHLVEGEQLALEIRCSVKDQLFVTWLPSRSNEPVDLYPLNSLKLPNTEAAHELAGECKIITIPRQGFIEITEGPGNDVCIVASRSKHFDAEARQAAHEIAASCARTRKLTPPIGNPNLITRTAARNLKQSQFGVRAPSQQAHWEKELINSMLQVSDKLRLFRIPNLGQP